VVDTELTRFSRGTAARDAIGELVMRFVLAVLVSIAFFRATGADDAEVDGLTWRALMVAVVVGLVLCRVVAARLAGRDSEAAG